MSAAKCRQGATFIFGVNSSSAECWAWLKHFFLPLSWSPCHSLSSSKQPKHFPTHRSHKPRVPSLNIPAYLVSLWNHHMVLMILSSNYFPALFPKDTTKAPFTHVSIASCFHLLLLSLESGEKDPKVAEVIVDTISSQSFIQINDSSWVRSRNSYKRFLWGNLGNECGFR